LELTAVPRGITKGRENDIITIGTAYILSIYMGEVKNLYVDTNISVEYAASVFRGEVIRARIWHVPPKTMISIYKTSRRYNPKYQYLNIHRCDIRKFRV
jgi:hypothetical protein